MNRLALAIILMFFLVTASGCMYAGEVKQDQALATGEYIAIVQHAVDQYKEKTGVLPIKNKDMTTPIYEKYPVDLKRLREYNFLGSVPPNAFENGGTAIYVLINAETKPEVKLMDLVAYQKLVEIQSQVNDYMVAHHDKIPGSEMVSPGFYRIDFSMLAMKDTQVRSPYSRQTLTLLMDEAGTVGIDYGPDILPAMAKKGMKDAPADLDLRTVLTDVGTFVPARSFPYHWLNGQPTVSLH